MRTKGKNLPSHHVCLMSGGVDSSIAACLLLGHPKHSLWPLYVRRGARAEQRELAALRGILPWLRKHGRGRLHRLRVLDLPYPLPALRRTYPGHVKERFGYVGREAVLGLVAVSYALGLSERHGGGFVVGTGSLHGDLFPHNSARYWRCFGRLLDIELGEFSVPIVHPLLSGSEIAPATKKAVIDFAGRIGFPLHLTWSCVKGNKTPCGRCAECVQRAKAGG